MPNTEEVKYVMTLQNQQFNNSVDESNSRVNGLESSLSKIGGAMLAVFAVDKVVVFGKSMIQLAMDNEQAEVSFKVLLGSAEKAKSILGDLRKMGAETPFEYKDLQSMALNLKNANVPAEELIGKLQKLGDISQGNVPKLDSLIRAYGKMNQTKKVSLEAINIMAESASFNPLLVLAKEMSETNNKAVDENMKTLYDGVSKGTVSMGMIEHAIDKVTSKGGDFYQMLNQQSKTSAGQLSNVMDQIGSNMTDMGTALLPYFNQVLTGISNMITFARDSVTGFIAFTQKYKTELKAVGVFVGLAAVGFTAYSIAVNASAIATAVATGATNLWTGAQWLLNAAMTANPIGLLITAIAAVAAGIYYAWEKSETFRGTLLGIWEVAKVLTNAFVALGKALVWPTMDNIEEAFSSLKNLKEGVPAAFNKGYKQGVDSFAKDNPKDLASAPNDLSQNKLATGGAKGLAAPSAPIAGLPSGSKVSSVKPTNINITIGSLVNELKIITQKLGIPEDQIASAISKLLIGTVNDANNLAGM
jgi:hypothetical protein